MMQKETLAINGGRAAVSARFRERWKKIHLQDFLPIMKCAYRDINTSAGTGWGIAAFEDAFAKLTQTRYALCMNSGTATLHSAYFAVGVKPGTEVIVPSYTWYASAAPILQCGATPVFCDIDERTLTADPEDVERRITSRTRAICVVHVWGNPAAMDRFVELARRYNVALVEDCSHAHGATYQGRPVGSWGDIGCFSLQGLKAVSGGECGIAVTNNPTLFDHMLVLGHNGRTKTGQAAQTFDIENFSLGLKYRPHLYAVLLAKASLERLPDLNRLRRRNYELLGEALKGCEAVRPVESYPGAEWGGLLEFILKYNPEHAGGWNREAFVHAARAEGIPVDADRYTRTGENSCMLHDSNLFSRLDFTQLGGCLSQVQGLEKAHLPVCERLSERLLTLPPFTLVSERFVRECASAFRKVAEYAQKNTWMQDAPLERDVNPKRSSTPAAHNF